MRQHRTIEFPKSQILEASLVGGILVVIGQVADPKIFHDIEELVVSHFSLKYITSSLRNYRSCAFLTGGIRREPGGEYDFICGGVQNIG